MPPQTDLTGIWIKLNIKRQAKNTYAKEQQQIREHEEMRDAIGNLAGRLAERQMHIDEISGRIRKICSLVLQNKLL